MKKIYLLVGILLFIIACSKTKKEYYSNGEIKKEYTKVKGKIHGEIKEYYENGNLKGVQKFQYGKLKDSIKIYRNDKLNSLEKIINPVNDSIFELLYFDTDNKLAYTGKVDKNDDKIGKWVYYKEKLDSIVEFVRYKGEPYFNQEWLIDKQGDTLHHKSNYYKLEAKDTVKLGSVLDFYFYLKQPFFGGDSEIEINIPKEGYRFYYDFSNIDEIELETVPNLKKLGKDTSKYPKNYPLNHFANFGIEFDGVGLKKIRGILKEFDTDSSKAKDDRWERWLFFEKEVYVKDSL